MATGSKLVIVESPTKAKKIGGYLGSEYTVMASVGHIRDLAQPSQVPAADKTKFGKFGVDVEDGFKPYYIVDGNKKKTVSELKSALKKADTLYLATDEDREGEAIAWHLVQTLKPKVPVKRMVFHEITKEAIKASLDNTRDVDDDMVDALVHGIVAVMAAGSGVTATEQDVEDVLYGDLAGGGAIRDPFALDEPQWGGSDW